MASRPRRIVILGLPLVLAVVAGVALRSVPQARAGAPPAARAVLDCPLDQLDQLDRPVAPGERTATAGTWWTQHPNLDEAGELAGWTLTLGAPRVDTLSMVLPPSSLVSGPVGGQVVAAADDETQSWIQVIDVPRRCARSVSVPGAIVRRAILAEDRSNLIAHLLDRVTRRDLGIWQVFLDGSGRTPLLPPMTDSALRSAGIDRIWTTDMRMSNDGTRLAVQSCDPDACVTRVIDLASRQVAVLAGEQGAMVGFTATSLVTLAACSGLPCDVVSWDIATLRPIIVATGTISAAISGSGNLVVATRNDDGTVSATEVDPGAGRGRPLGILEPGTIPLGPSATSGIEAAPGSIGLERTGGPPSMLVIDLPVHPDAEIQP